MPRLELDLDPPKPAVKPRWPWIVGGIALFLFVVFVWPTPYHYEHAGTMLVRINRFTGDCTIIVYGRGSSE